MVSLIDGWFLGMLGKNFEFLLAASAVPEAKRTTMTMTVANVVGGNNELLFLAVVGILDDFDFDDK